VRLLAAVVLLAVSVSCSNSSESYTLYRDSGLDPALRVHLATFDAKDGRSYNETNCTMMADLYNEKYSDTNKAWCEQGTYKK